MKIDKQLSFTEKHCHLWVLEVKKKYELLQFKST